MKFILASTSKYRQALLKRLCIPFTCESPEVDETPYPQEAGDKLALRLALAKANAIANTHSGEHCYIIGSDQVAVVNDLPVGKPGNFENAFKQLRQASGQSITFYTGLVVINCLTGKTFSLLEPFTVKFRSLSDTQIANYLKIEMPYDCAGSFKCEGLGIALFEAMEGRDPNSLIGLPLIGFLELLRLQGFELLDHLPID